MHIQLLTIVILFMCTSAHAEFGSQTLSKEQILEKFNAIEVLYYEAVTQTSSTMPLPGQGALSEEKFWYKKGYLRWDNFTPSANAKKRIVIDTPEGTYIYNSFTDETTKSENALKIPKKMLFSFLYSQLEKQSDINFLGTEMINGRLTTVVEFYMDFTESKEQDRFLRIKGTKQRAWIDNATGLPLKQQMVSQLFDYPLDFTTNVDYKNFSFTEIPDSVFEILKEGKGKKTSYKESSVKK